MLGKALFLGLSVQTSPVSGAGTTVLVGVFFFGLAVAFVTRPLAVLDAETSGVLSFGGRPLRGDSGAAALLADSVDCFTAIDFLIDDFGVAVFFPFFLAFGDTVGKVSLASLKARTKSSLTEEALLPASAFCAFFDLVEEAATLAGEALLTEDVLAFFAGDFLTGVFFAGVVFAGAADCLTATALAGATFFTGIADCLTATALASEAFFFGAAFFTTRDVTAITSAPTALAVCTAFRGDRRGGAFSDAGLDAALVLPAGRPLFGDSTFSLAMIG